MMRGSWLFTWMSTGRVTSRHRASAKMPWWGLACVLSKFGLSTTELKRTHREDRGPVHQEWPEVSVLRPPGEDQLGAE